MRTWRGVTPRSGGVHSRPALTIGHELHDKPRVGDVGTAHLGSAHALAHLGHHARHLVCGKEGTTWLGRDLVWGHRSLKWGREILMEDRWDLWWEVGLDDGFPNQRTVTERGNRRL